MNLIGRLYPKTDLGIYPFPGGVPKITPFLRGARFLLWLTNNLQPGNIPKQYEDYD